MQPYELFKDVKVMDSTVNEVKRRYSVTGDVLSYRRCPRLYANISIKDFSPAQPSQLYVGTIIHEVLDRAHAHYTGRYDPSHKGQVPSKEDIEKYFIQVETALKAHGIRPFSPDLAEYVKRVITKFNEIEGPSLYPRVLDTEHRLQDDKGDHFLYGVVDVLLASDGTSKEDKKVEIWDYKGMKRPDPSRKFGKSIIDDFDFQMQVYSYLYFKRNGYYPQRAIIYFVGELQEENTSRPDSALMEVTIDTSKTSLAVAEFEKTVESIESSRKSQIWEAPVDGHETAGKETCNACDIRFSCGVEKSNYKPKLP